MKRTRDYMELDECSRHLLQVLEEVDRQQRPFLTYLLEMAVIESLKNSNRSRRAVGATLGAAPAAKSFASAEEVA